MKELYKRIAAYLGKTGIIRTEDDEVYVGIQAIDWQKKTLEYLIHDN